MKQLTQSEIDLVLGLRWEEIVDIRTQLAKVDEQRDGLAYVAEQYDQRKLVSIMLLDESGNVYFNHRTTPGEACKLTDNVLQECTAHLIRKRRSVFDVPPPPLTVEPQKTTQVALPDPEQIPTDTPLFWYSKEELIEVKGISPKSVYAYANYHKLPRKRNGKNVLYGLTA